MKINEVMLEASVDRKQFGKETVRANQKANIARSAAFRKQMDAPSATEPAAAAPAAPAAKPNYGAGGAGIPNIQATPVQKLPQPAAKPATQASPTPNYGPKFGTTAVPGRTTTGPEAANIVGSNFMKGFAQGLGSDKLAQAADAASRSNISAQGAKAGTPTTPGEITQDSPVATPAQEPATAKQAGTEEPGQPQTQDSPIAKPEAVKPVAAPTPAAAPAPALAAAKGKTMTKQEIMAWISRNDEDNAALQSFKDGITAAEKAGAPAGADYGKATPGIQNVQAAPGKVSYAPKTAAPAATPSYAAPKVAVPAARQPQMASKQYKKVPL